MSMSQRTGVGIIVALVVLVIGLLVVVPMFGMIMWAPMMGGGMMGGWGYPSGYGWGRPAGLGWGFMFGGMLIPLLFIVLLIVGGYYLLGPRTETARSETALAILDERYAKGEITKEQYREMKQELARK
jgi:putative membrane protein